MVLGGVMTGRPAGSGVGKYNVKSSKQDNKRFKFIPKTSHFAHLVILFINEVDATAILASFYGQNETLSIYI